MQTPNKTFMIAMPAQLTLDMQIGMFYGITSHNEFRGI